MEKSFRQISLDQRLEYLRDHRGLSEGQTSLFKSGSLPTDIAENLIENAIGYFQLPIGIATNFRIDGKDRMIPMAVEETSIIAAASAAAKWIRSQGEITTKALGKLIIGQIQLPRVKTPSSVKALLMANRELLIRSANQLLPGLIARGGGVREIEAREVPRADGSGEMIVLHLLCDPCDAMGANLINQVCESLKPLVEELTGETAGLCILSNLVDGKRVAAEVVIHDIDPALGMGISEASLFAESDPYRAATHNKGILNGIDPVLIATGNDWRAVEAGVHAYAARDGRYRPLSSWKMRDRDLVGRIELPLAIGVVGGVTRIHPMAQASLKILEVSGAEELARICAAVGLVQNLGALKALSTVGIVRGHMELHASNLALAAGSSPSEVHQVRMALTELLKQEKKIGITVAQEILKDLRSEAARARGTS